MSPRPLLLAHDNFTPQARTPWGGTRIVGRVKRALFPNAPQTVVGESWEVSVEPDFPSRVQPQGERLDALIASDPQAWLGSEARRGGTALLVKLLDAAEELSVQIHPSDDYVGLSAGEGGKPESWYIVDAEPGAGLYLGLAPHATPEVMRTALEHGHDVSKLLHFVPVSPGDFFLIEAGTAHAIGRGLLLVEPQFVAPGKRGLTYRFWDWNRRYNAQGVQSADGKPRALHIDDALAVTRWDAPRGEALIDSIRVRGGIPDLSAPPKIDRFSGKNAPLSSAFLDVSRVYGSGRIALPAANAFRGLTVFTGEITIAYDGNALRVPAGMSAALPASLMNATLLLRDAHALLCATP